MIRRFLRWLIGYQPPADHVQIPLAEPVEAQLATIRTKLGELEQQWADVQDWLARWTKRQNARNRRAVKAALGEEEGEGVEMPTGGEIVDPGASQRPPPDRKAYLRRMLAAQRQNGGTR